MFSLIVMTSQHTAIAQEAPAVIAGTDPDKSNNSKPGQYISPQQSFLPGSLVGWSARLNNNKVSLKWTTTFEKNSSEFVVERSVNGVKYEPVETLKAARNSDKKKHYSFTDNLATGIKGIVYYRLKMVDVDEEVKYSEVKIIRQQKSEGTEIALYPNPTVNEVKVTIASEWQNDKIVYEIYNSHGQVVTKRTNAHTSQTEVFNIKDLPAGIYVMTVSNGTNKKIKQFIKSNSTLHF